MSTAAVLVAGLLLASFWTGSLVSDLGRALLAVSGARCGLFLVLALISPRSLPGWGDVKLAALLGLFLGWFGWPAVAVAVIATLFLLGGLRPRCCWCCRAARRGAPSSRSVRGSSSGAPPPSPPDDHLT